MSIERALARPPRCVLTNVSTAESMECLFNPTQLSENVQVNWNRLAVPGLSHQILQFQSTGNRQFQAVEFYLDRFFVAQQPGNVDILQFRAFLRSLTVPKESTQTVIETAPPRTLIIWPQIITVEAIVTSLEFKYKRIAIDGNILIYTATVSFEEILDVRVTSENLREEA